MAEETAPSPEAPEDPGRGVRELMRRAGRAALASALARDGSGRPYVSLALVGVDHDASPVLLLSDLADHARNLRADPRAALLFDGTAGHDDPLSGPRATVLGEVREVADPALGDPLKARFLARHPGARRYADFADFRLYRMAMEGAHLVAGFGRIHWLVAREVLFDTTACAPLAAAEAEIVAHLNHDHGNALRLIARAILGLEEAPPGDPGWTMTGIDPEGFDLRYGPRLARAGFERPVSDPEGARRALVLLTKRARDLSAVE